MAPPPPLPAPKIHRLYYWPDDPNVFNGLINPIQGPLIPKYFQPLQVRVFNGFTRPPSPRLYYFQPLQVRFDALITRFPQIASHLEQINRTEHVHMMEKPHPLPTLQIALSAGGTPNPIQGKPHPVPLGVTGNITRVVGGSVYGE